MPVIFSSLLKEWEPMTPCATVSQFSLLPCMPRTPDTPGQSIIKGERRLPLSQLVTFPGTHALLPICQYGALLALSRQCGVSSAGTLTSLHTQTLLPGLAAASRGFQAQEDGSWQWQQGVCSLVLLIGCEDTGKQLGPYWYGGSLAVGERSYGWRLGSVPSSWEVQESR